MKPVLVLQHIHCEGPGRLFSFAETHRLELSVLNLAKVPIFPSDPASYAALIVLGGPMNVYEEEKYLFLKPETDFIRKAIAQEIPYLGICLGGQLLAKAMGGCVTRNLHKEIGHFPISLTESGLQDPLFEGLPAKNSVFQWHGDTFSEIGKGVRLATSEKCFNQAFRWGKNAYGLQFHIETTTEMAQKWFTEYDPEIQAEKLDPALLLQEFLAHDSQYQQISKRIFHNFFKISGMIFNNEPITDRRSLL